jgi:threonine dehydratase
VGTFVHQFDYHDFIAGNATCGLEILEDLPDVKTVIAAIGGGGLVSGIGSAMRALAPQVRVLGAEPETAAPGAVSFAAARRKCSRIGKRRSSTARVEEHLPAHGSG